ncbi:MAG: helix-turn-helix transcriptional regulator [Lachnospiraceae bacterium]
MDQLSLPCLPPNSLMDASCNPILYFSEDESSVKHIMLALHELDSQESGNPYACTRLADALLHIIYEKLHTLNQSRLSVRSTHESLIQEITAYLEQHLMESVTLKELGEKFHMSYYYLSHIYKTQTGLSPMKYVMHRKIGESQNLLMNTSMLIGEISETLGFSDNCHFNVTFKKYVGMTPSQYRQYFQNKAGTSG